MVFHENCGKIFGKVDSFPQKFGENLGIAVENSHVKWKKPLG